MEKLPHVAYRHLVVTVPIKMGLRKRFRSDRRLLRAMARLIQRVLCRWMPQQISCHRNRREQRDKALPGVISACQTFGKARSEAAGWHTKADLRYNAPNVQHDLHRHEVAFLYDDPQGGRVEVRGRLTADRPNSPHFHVDGYDQRFNLNLLPAFAYKP